MEYEEEECPSYTRKGLLGNIQWHQSIPFNYNLVFNGQRCKTGCPGTAIAQVVFYLYKKFGIIRGCSGTPKYDSSWNNFTCTVEALPLIQQFDYENLQDSYGLNTGTQTFHPEDATHRAVAEFMEYICKAIKTNFSPASSMQYIKASVPYIQNILRIGQVEYFRESTHPNTFEQLIQQSLLNDIPVWVVGAKYSDASKGGHYFIIDGWTGGNYYHYNMGGGPNSQDGWYRLNLSNTQKDPPSSYYQIRKNQWVTKTTIYGYHREYARLVRVPKPLVEDVNEDGYINMVDVSRVIAALSDTTVFVFTKQYKWYGLPVRPILYPENQSSTTSEHEYVDLLLPSRKLWATCNIGAESPLDTGDRYSWGEVTTKDAYNQASYTLKAQSISGTDKDPAHVKWGNGWRMPSCEDFMELQTYCTFKIGRYEDIMGVEIARKFTDEEKTAFLTTYMENHQVGESEANLAWRKYVAKCKIHFPLSGYQNNNTVSEEEVELRLWAGDARTLSAEGLPNLSKYASSSYNTQIALPLIYYLILKVLIMIFQKTLIMMVMLLRLIQT